MPETDPFFDELNREIAEATAKSRLKADAAKLKKQSNNMRISPAERQAAAAEFRTIQSIVEANEWEAVKCAAMFTQQHCDGCDSIHYTFLQYMQEEEKVRDRHSRRWMRIELPATRLPKETIIQPLVTHICSNCAPDHGFNIDAPEIRLMPSIGSLTVSHNYIQGDINDCVE